MEPERCLADQPERALRADHQPRQIVAGGGLPGPRAGVHHLAAAAHDREREHVLAHRAVPHGHRPGCPRRDHPADRGVGARIDREEHSLGTEAGIERAPGHAGADGHVEVLDRGLADLVHLPHVDADAAGQRRDVALERGAGAERHQRHVVLGGDPHNSGRLLDAPRPDHHVGARLGVERLVVTVLGEDVGAGAHPVCAEQVGKRLAARRDARRRRARHRGHVHHRHCTKVARLRRASSEERWP